jgi:hypothetical protein
LWKEIFCEDCFSEIQKIARMGKKKFHMPTELWVQILYELAAIFHAWQQNRMRLVELVTPLYYARVASFVNQTLRMSSQEAEKLVEEQAQEFENNKDYLIQIWDQKAAQAGKA